MVSPQAKQSSWLIWVLVAVIVILGLIIMVVLWLSPAKDGAQTAPATDSEVSVTIGDNSTTPLTNDSAGSNEVDVSVTIEGTEGVYAGGETVLVGIVKPLECIDSGQGEPCSANWMQLEIDLVRDSDGELFTGDFYLRVYNKLGIIGEERIIPNWNPFAGDGGNGTTHGPDSPMTVEAPLANNFSVKYLDVVPNMEYVGPGYQLILNDVDGMGTQSGRAFQLISSQGHVEISFPQ